MIKNLLIIAVLIKISNSKITKNKTILPYIVGTYKLETLGILQVIRTTIMLALKQPENWVCKYAFRLQIQYARVVCG